MYMLNLVRSRVKLKCTHMPTHNFCVLLDIGVFGLCFVRFSVEMWESMMHDIRSMSLVIYCMRAALNSYTCPSLQSSDS